MNNKQPRFAQGLFIQLFLSLALKWLISYTPELGPAFAALLSLLARVFWITFSLGLLYGFFRLCGIKNADIDWFYDQFPFGYLAKLFKGGKTEAVQALPVEAAEVSSSDSKTTSFNWEKLLSPMTLQSLGMLLIFTAVSSLLFKVAWSLELKLATSGVVGAGLTLVSFWFGSREKQIFATISNILGFASLQFCLSLASSYLASTAPSFFANAEFWLLAKFCLTVVFVCFLSPSTVRYHAPAIFLVGFIAPLSMAHYNVTITLIPISLFVIAMHALFLFVWTKRKESDLWSLGSIASTFLLLNYAYDNITTNMSLFSLAINLPEQLAAGILIAASINFVLHFAWSAPVLQSTPTARASIQFATFSHQIIFLALAAILSTSIPFVRDHLGVVVLASALAPFLVGLFLSRSKDTAILSERYINLTIVVGSVGLFLEANDPWSALVFLTFSCLITWYALRSGVRRTKIYAVVILGLSVFKLYTESRAIFESIPGNFIVILLGGFLIVISQKYGAIKKAFTDKDNIGSD